MSLDGKLLRRAKEALDRRRAQNEEEFARRREEAYARNPRLREIDRHLRENAANAVVTALRRGGDPSEALDAVREENMALQESRRVELMRVGLPTDYLDERYVCPKCRDTGYRGTELCVCLLELYAEEQRRDLSALLKLGEETFASFRLDYYDDIPDPRTGVSPRAVMESVYELCLGYARGFSTDSPNLFLSGGTGLGKTFLSTCIAREVSERGYSVVYDTAVSVFSKYEADKFGRGDPDGAKSEVRRLESCDLLLLDDLGTEFVTGFVVTALYTLINTRLTAGKKTVISSNLTVEELGGRYSPAVMSRLLGEFYTVKFAGSDVRLRKKALG